MGSAYLTYISFPFGLPKDTKWEALLWRKCSPFDLPITAGISGYTEWVVLLRASREAPTKNA